MPRPDFEKLVALVRDDRLPKGYSAEPYSGDWNYPVFIKYHDDNVAVDARYEGGIGRLWMDVIPVEGLPDDLCEVERIYGDARKLRRISMLCKADSHEGKTLAKRIIKRVVTPVIRVMGIGRRSLEKLDKLGRECAYGSSSWAGCVTWGLYGPGERYPVNGWDSLVRLEFEGMELSAIGCWDEYLHGIYGDYMQLPPENKRVTHELKAWRID